FGTNEGRRIAITYNPQFDDRETTLIPQRPDILIRFEEEGWPRIQLICDAKYRVDASDEYRQQYGSCGPPRDAINVLHRYRDAILEYGGIVDSQLPKRSIIQAAALFPYNEERAGDFRQSRLWLSLDRLGIGAIPALPSSLGYLDEWLTTVLREGGWSLAERVIPHMVEQQATDWRRAAGEPVLVGVLSSGNAKQRLGWITENKTFYHPLPKTPHRHFRVVCVALYSPKSLLQTPAISHAGQVAAIEVRPRKDLDTPWTWRGSGSDLMLVYRLGSVQRLPRLIENRSDDSTTFRMDRWTSRLALNRARSAIEIILETEPEWRLYEVLRARKIQFQIVTDRIRVQSPDSPVGRAWFKLPNETRVRYDGANGFLLDDAVLERRSYYSLAELLKVLARKLPTADR
ncbi:MAG: nuclease domain-containing protein, partial [Thermoguttaceae bacterium]